MAQSDSHRTFSVSVILSTAVLLCAGWLLVFQQIGTIERVQLADARADAANLSRINSLHAASALNRVDRMMQYFAANYRSDAAAFNPLRVTMEQLVGDAAMVAQFGLTDAQGVLRQSSLNLARGMDLSQREYFKAHRGRDGTQMLVSAPVLDTISGKWVIELSRRLNHHDGSFDGVMVVWMPVDFFTNHYAALELPRDSVQLFAGLDGVVFARLRGTEVVLGQLQATQPLLAQASSGQSSGAAVFTSKTDGVERSYSFQRVAGYPLVVMIGLSTAGITEAAAFSRNALIAESALVSLLLVAAAAGLLQYALRQRAQLGVRTQLSLALLRSEERWKTALQGSNAAVWDWDAASDAIYVFTGGSMFAALPSEATYKMPVWMEMIHPQDRARVQQEFIRHLKRKSEVFETELRHQSGNADYRWYALRGLASFNERGRALRVSGYARDITEQRSASTEAAERAAQLDAVFSMSTDAFVTFDAEHRVNHANPAFCQFTGLQLPAVVGLLEPQFVAIMNTLSVATRPFPEMERLALVAAQAERSEPVLVELVRPRRRVLSVSVKLGGSKAASQVLYLRDITESILADEMKSDFLSTAAHELRTPMTNVLGFAELLIGNEFTTEQRSEFHGIIHSESVRVAEILDELLDLARIEARRGQDFSVQRVNLKMVVQGAVDAFNVPKGRQPPEVNLPDLYCRSDLGKTTQIFNNILSNAYKYSRDQGGSVVVSAAPISHADVGHMVGIVIEDQGKGMAAHELERVFERFYRADKSGTIKGTGLGMSIVKELMDLLGGRVSIVSTAGRGTAVTLLFPSACALGRHCSDCDLDSANCPQVEPF